MSKSEAIKSKKYWTFIRETAREVEGWPNWMKGDTAVGEKEELPGKAQKCEGGRKQQGGKG